MMLESDYVTVRRHSDTPFRVLSGDLVSENPTGYDLTLVRSLAYEGLTTPITVSPLPGGRFQVVDGLKRLAAIRILLRTNKLVYDAMRGRMRPARGAFALVRCRLERRPPGP